MRTIEEVRDYLIDPLALALRRPAMWGGNDFGIAQFFRERIGSLCWIDEGREIRRAVIPVRHELGIVGELASQHFNWPDYGNEVASYFAQYFHALGYWCPERLLGQGDWTRLRQSLCASFFERDWSSSSIKEQFGTPSFVVGGGNSFVQAYAPQDPAELWIFFDFARKLRPADCEDWLPDPRLRDVRIGSNTMTPLPFAIQSEIGRETVQTDDWRTLEPRLDDHADRDDVDIVPVVAGIRRQLSGVRVQRIAKRHPGDMWGVWYFSWKQGGPEIRLSSMVGFAPYFVAIPQRPPEAELDGFVLTREEAIETVVSHLKPLHT